jgi:hypothetical protein
MRMTSQTDLPNRANLDLGLARPISSNQACNVAWELTMAIYRVRETRLVEADSGSEKLIPLREFELMAVDQHAAIEEVRHFLEVELLNLRNRQTVDFDALIVLDEDRVEVARFNVADVWKREADAVNSGHVYSHWV